MNVEGNLGDAARDFLGVDLDIRIVDEQEVHCSSEDGKIVVSFEVQKKAGGNKNSPNMLCLIIEAIRIQMKPATRRGEE